MKVENKCFQYQFPCIQGNFPLPLILCERVTLQGINISHLGKRKISFKYALSGGYVSSPEGKHPPSLQVSPTAPFIVGRMRGIVTVDDGGGTAADTPAPWRLLRLTSSRLVGILLVGCTPTNVPLWEIPIWALYSGYLWSSSWWLNQPIWYEHQIFILPPASCLGYVDPKYDCFKLVGDKVYILVGGWTNPFEKYARQIGSFPQGAVQTKNIWNHHLVICWYEHQYIWPNDNVSPT